MKYTNLMQAYIARGSEIVGMNIKDSSGKRRIENLVGNKLDLKAILEDKTIIRYSNFPHYNCKNEDLWSKTLITPFNSIKHRD